MADIVFDLIEKENQRQLKGIELIASENFASPEVMRAAGTVLTNKYAEGLPGKRYYGGCEVVDEIETLAIERAKELFGAEWANVQPHSGAQANMAVMLACLEPGDTILGFDLSHGGHLSHGHPANFSGKYFRPTYYGVEEETGLIDWDKVEAKADAENPKMIICGASAYSRDWDYVRLRQIADKHGAILLADISHPSGLIAAGLLNDPLPHCHIVTTTTHKTLRGPRGGLIMVGKDMPNPMGKTTKKGTVRKLSSILDGAVFPGIQGGPLEHIIGAKAVAFGEALTPGFTTYAQQVKDNAAALAKGLVDRGYAIISGGTDNHSMLIDLRNKGLTGRDAEDTLIKADITINKNMVPYDTESAMVTSGMRLGTPAITSRGLKQGDMDTVADLIDQALMAKGNDTQLGKLRGQVNELMSGYPLFQW